MYMMTRMGEGHRGDAGVKGRLQGGRVIMTLRQSKQGSHLDKKENNDKAMKGHIDASLPEIERASGPHLKRQEGSP